MKLCSNHMRDLAEALKRKGLGRYINDDPAKAKLVAVKWLKGQSRPDDPSDFDPLAVGVLEIYQKATDLNLPVDTYVGPFIQHRCPLCALTLIKHAPEQWVDNLTDRLVVHAHLHDMRVGA